jgi:hypothetical protein
MRLRPADSEDQALSYSLHARASGPLYQSMALIKHQFSSANRVLCTVSKSSFANPTAAVYRCIVDFSLGRLDMFCRVIIVDAFVFQRNSLMGGSEPFVEQDRSFLGNTNLCFWPGTPGASVFANRHGLSRC